MSSDSRPLSVLIAGGGIAGPCFAYWLTRAGLDPRPNITIIERAPEPRTTGQSVDIRDAAVEVMRKMGLEETIRACRTPEKGTAFVDGKGKIIARFDSSGDSEKQSMTSEYEILRAELAKVFIDATKDRECISYVFGQRIAEISQDESGVDVTFTGDMPKQRYDLIVAADGTMSKTRQAIFGPDEPSYFNFLGGYFAFFSIPYDSDLDEPPLWRWFNAPGGLSVQTRPHTNPETTGAYLGLVTPQKQRNPETEKALTEGLEAQKALCKKMFQDAGWQAKRVCNGLDTASDFYMTPLTQVKLPKWSKGRCICLGDAAYSPTPITGAGTSLAMEGAYLLAGEIAASGGDVRLAFDNYEKIFRPTVEKVQKLPPGVPQIANPNTAFGITLARLALSLVYNSGIYKILGGWVDSKPRKLRDYKWALG
ncbi:FAD/NAD(P)-binding domain-containing protein [Microthyrium microscopicum]|uniref:FAD/NAD(P)-binding domain-containing protein n=1 Tax=Microthyrium microscopicum TaxID=703497 RepID=A0A6A6TXF9_9PEZI|nr:FAD/NAD(P)-binding domain-containing protein [Microthyrium microscopicum]